MELNKKQKEIFNLFKTGQNIFISGPAGVGKSFLLQMMKTWGIENNVNIGVTALTGAAAFLIGGKTVHSYCGIGLGEEKEDVLLYKVKKNYIIKRRWKNVNCLIIDEISMMTPELFEKLDYIAKSIRQCDAPFGGIQIILSGDFYQLPPINKGLNQYKEDSKLFCFESPLWNKLVSNIIELEDIIRQKDPIFQQCLNEIREGKCSDETKKILKKRLEIKPDTLNGIEPTRLFTRKSDVDVLNNKKLVELDNEIKIFNAFSKISKIYQESEQTKSSLKDIDKVISIMDRDAPYNIELKLCIGAQVMLLTNKDFNLGLVNGSRGVVIRFSNSGYPIVKFLSGLEVEIDTHSWEFDNREKNLLIIRKQIPLKLAWAYTIHKSQGSSLDYVIVDIGKSIFECGQSYVALSRVRSLEGLFLVDFAPKKIMAHPRVVNFYKNMKDKNKQKVEELAKDSIKKYFS